MNPLPFHRAPYDEMRGSRFARLKRTLVYSCESGTKRMRILLVHGPNLNRLGSRDRTIYGTVTLAEIVDAAREHARAKGAEVVPFQSNHEGDLIDWIQAQAPQADAIVINPGGLAHSSVSLRDALEDARVPVVEVHISDPAAREPFRHPLITATAAATIITGKGLAGYLEAFDFVLSRPGGQARALRDRR